MYSKADINTIRTTIDIIEFLERRGITFKQTGTAYVGLCPIHNEKSGSFNVRPDNNTFHCFGCGAGGDIISLVQQMEGLSFVGAIQMLAEEYNIKLESVDEDPEYKKLQRLYRICQLASRFYREQYVALPDSHPAKKNLEERMLKSEGDKDLSIGFAPMTGLLDILFTEKFSKEEIAATGLIKITEEGKTVQLFRNRLIWTINDIQGRPIAFSARKIFEEDNGPKYINSPATRLYNKSKTLMGLDVARKVTNKTQSLYVVEGATDIMAFRAAGFENAVATCGTAFGPEHASVVLGLAAANKDSARFKIYFCFDGDSAGLEAAKKVFNRNKNLITISSVIKFTEGDPCDIRLKGGNHALQEIVNKGGVPIVEFMLREEMNTWDIKTAEGLSNFVNAAKDIIKDVPSVVEQEAYMRKVSTWTGIGVDRLTSRSSRPAEQEKTIVIKSDLYDKILAGLVQHPDKILPIFKKYNLSGMHFPDEDLAHKALEAVESNNINPSDFSSLMMTVVAPEDRIESTIDLMVRNLLKSLYAEEVKQLKIRMAQSDGNTDDDDDSFAEYMSEMDILKKKYFM